MTIGQNLLPKPHYNEFLIRGIPLRIALDALARWETLSENELEDLGFICSEASAERAANQLEQVRSSLH